MMVCGICSYPINVDTDEPIGSNFFLGSSHDPDDCLYRTFMPRKNVEIFKKFGNPSSIIVYRKVSKILSFYITKKIRQLENQHFRIKTDTRKAHYNSQ